MLCFCYAKTLSFFFASDPLVVFIAEFIHDIYCMYVIPYTSDSSNPEARLCGWGVYLSLTMGEAIGLQG